MTVAQVARHMKTARLSLLWMSISFFACSATWACLIADERTNVASQGIGHLIDTSTYAVSTQAQYDVKPDTSLASVLLSTADQGVATRRQLETYRLKARQQLQQQLAQQSQRDLAVGYMQGLSDKAHRTINPQATSSTALEEFLSIPVHPGHSGAWSSPERDGEGVQVEILSATRALVFWFTYRAEGEPTQGQFWMGGTGDIVGNQIIIDNVVSTSGPVFGPDFDPADVVREPWGQFIVEFDACDSGRILYQGSAEFGTGSIGLQRLTGNPRVPCGADSSAFQGPSADVPGVSGNWFDPAHDGEGWFIQEIAPGIAGFSWLTYNDMGQQVWMLGIGFWRGRTLIVPEMQITNGANFGDAFDAADVQRSDWGVVQFIFDTCDQATLVYNSPVPGFGSGVLHPQRLTRSDFVPCAFESLAPLVAGNWQLQGGAPELSEVPSTQRDEHIYIAGGFRNGFRSRREFWRYTPATQAWLRMADLPQARDHGMMANYENRLYFFGGAVDGGSLRTAWIYDDVGDRWDSLPVMPNARSAGGAVVLNDFIYLIGGEPDTDVIDRFDPATQEWTSFPLPEFTGRDHSAAVVYRDEIWLMGGRRAGAAHGFITIFNPLTGVVRTGPPIRTPRSGFAATVFAGQIVVAGGENFAPLLTTNTAEYYSPENGEWRSLPNSPSAVHGVSAVSLNGRVYLMPGSISTGGVNNPGQIQIFSP